MPRMPILNSCAILLYPGSMAYRLFICFLICVLLTIAQNAHAVLVWDPIDGWKDETSSVILSRIKSNPKDQFLLGRSLEAAGDYSGAWRAYSHLEYTWPISPDAPEAKFRQTCVLLRAGSPYSAIMNSVGLVRKYPRSPFAWCTALVLLVLAAGVLAVTGAVTRYGIQRRKSMPESAEIKRSPV